LISSQRMLYQCLESLVAKIQPGVVLNFEKYGNDPVPIRDDIPSQIALDRNWEKCRKMILIPKNQSTKGYVVGHWPIPEDFWLGLNSANLVRLTPNSCTR
jgi:integrator complex subunit 6